MLHTAQFNAQEDPYLYQYESSLLRPGLTEYCLIYLTVHQDWNNGLKPLDFTQISDDNYFNLLDAFELYRADAMPDFSDFELVGQNEPTEAEFNSELCEKIYARIVWSALKIMSYRYDLEEEAQEVRDQWNGVFRTMIQIQSQKDYLQKFLPLENQLKESCSRLT